MPLCSVPPLTCALMIHCCFKQADAGRLESDSESFAESVSESENDFFFSMRSAGGDVENSDSEYSQDDCCSKVCLT